MPITRKQFELVAKDKFDAVASEVVEFLSHHRDEAFTTEELMSALALEASLINVVLFHLSETGAIDAREVDRPSVGLVTYYASNLRPTR